MRYGLGYSIATKMAAWFSRNIIYYRTVEINEILKHTKKSQKILDFGCNDAYITRLIKKNSPSSEVQGADINKKALNRAKKRNKNIKFSIINKKFYKKNKNSFDLIILSHVLEHAPNPEVMLGNINSLIKPGGKIIVCVPYEVIRGEKTLLQIVHNVIRWKFENPHKHKLKYNKCKKMLEKKGFNVLSFKYTKVFSKLAKKKKPFFAGSLILIAKEKNNFPHLTC